MLRLAAVLLVLAFGPAQSEPAPRPVGYPADICVAEGANASNRLCGTCSTSVIYSTPELGTYIGWVCLWPDGEWRTHEIVRPWGSRWHQPSAATLDGMWDANAVKPDQAAIDKYAVLVSLARPHLASVWRPAAPAPVTWIVAPVSTRLRPSYLMIDGKAVRETAQFIPTGTPAAPTACACEAEATGAQLCRVPNFVTASGAARYASCIRK